MNRLFYIIFQSIIDNFSTVTVGRLHLKEIFLRHNSRSSAPSSVLIMLLLTPSTHCFLGFPLPLLLYLFHFNYFCSVTSYSLQIPRPSQSSVVYYPGNVVWDISNFYVFRFLFFSILNFLDVLSQKFIFIYLFYLFI